MKRTIIALLLAGAATSTPAQMGMGGGMGNHMNHGMMGGGETAKPAPETRQAVVLNADEQAMVLAEMRGFMESVQGVLSAVAAKDAKALAEAAGKSGMKVMGHLPMATRAKFPPALMAIGRATHMGFDSLAADAAGGTVPADTVARLATISGQCVACHAAFRFEVQ
jgi:hypothetical protein